MENQSEFRSISVSVSNVGGIDSFETTFDPGVTVLTGRNATNRTSLLRAIAGALGGSMATLKSDAEEGHVELAIDGERFTRRYERDGTGVRADGDPYTDEEALVDVFSCLVGSNPARRAVERGDGRELRDVLMRPVDTASIESRIDEYNGELRRVEDRLAEIEREKARLPTLEERRRELEAELERIEGEFAEVREAVDEYEADADEAEAAEAVLDELQETRGELEDVRDRISTQRNAVDALREERAEIREELDELSVPGEELQAIERELNRLRERERRLDNTINNLISIVEFNGDLLEDDAEELPDAGSNGRDVTDDLDPMSERIACWTCGTTVERRDIAGQLETLRDLIEEKRTERNSVRERIRSRESTLSDLREAAGRRDDLQERLGRTEDEIEDRESTIEDLEGRRETLQARVDELEGKAEETEGLRDSDLLEGYRRLSELEYERGQVEGDLSNVEEEIAGIEETAAGEDDLRARRSEIRDELESLRTRIEDVERSAAETFNEHMATLLGILDYDNIERVWIERKAGDAGRGEMPEGTFELHVVRVSEEGSVYEDSIGTLSESEREVIGLVVALAGYLVHDVHEHVPAILLDSLESIDAARIATLVEYFAEYAPFLIAVLLPEDAAAVDGDYHRVTMGEIPA